MSYRALGYKLGFRAINLFFQLFLQYTGSVDLFRTEMNKSRRGKQLTARINLATCDEPKRLGTAVCTTAFIRTTNDSAGCRANTNVCIP